MTKMFPCERVDVSFIETAPYRFTNSVDLAITPEQLFEVLADAFATLGERDHQGHLDQPRAPRCGYHRHRRHARRHRWR